MRNAVRLAPLVFLALATSLPATAVSLSPNGMGQVLIYPYYTVRESPQNGSPYNTLFSLVNGAIRGKVVKVRAREAKAGATVFEANVFLSVKDVWTAAIVPVDDGAGLMSTDHTCTRPSLLPGANGLPAANGVFRSDLYASDPLGPAKDRVREGFIEVIEMGEVRGQSTLDLAITHVIGVALCNIGSDASIVADLDPPSGQMYGSITLVNVLEGTAYGYDAVALANWSRVVLYGAPGSEFPTLAGANPPVSSVVDSERLAISTWSSGVDAVNAVLSAASLEAEFMREASVNGATDIAYTMPTKPLLVSPQSALPPFAFPLTAEGACEPANDSSLSREEQLYNPNQPELPLRPQHGMLCWATTVQSLNAIWPAPTAVVGSRTGLRHFQVDIELFPTPTIYPAGVAYQGFVGYPPQGFSGLTIARDLRAPGTTLFVDLQTGAQTQAQGVVYSGLPTVGVSFVRYVNGTLSVGGVQTLANYGAGSAVKARAGISVP